MNIQNRFIIVNRHVCLFLDLGKRFFDCQTIFGKRYGLRPYNRKLRKKEKKKYYCYPEQTIQFIPLCFQVYFHTFVKLDFKVEYYIIYHLFQAIY